MSRYNTTLCLLCQDLNSVNYIEEHKKGVFDLLKMYNKYIGM